MSDREKGLLSFPANFELEFQGPIDGRQKVKTLASLILENTWKANDGGVYTWVGMTTSVTEDPVTENNGVYWLKALPYTVAENWEKLAGGNLGEPTYTNTTGILTTLGGFTKGDTTDKMTFAQFADKLLNPEINPTYTGPSVDIASSEPTIVEVNSEIPITISATYNAGAINLDGEKVGNRAGAANKYTYSKSLNGAAATTVDQLSTDTTDEYSETLKISTPGNAVFDVTVAYDAGVQPTTNKGNDVDTPLAAGTIKSTTVEFVAVFPMFATTTSLTEPTKQPLTVGEYYEVTLMAEDDTNKQSVEIAQDLTVTGIQMLNTLSGKWEWLNGSKAASVGAFTQGADTVIKTLTGVIYNYESYTNASSKVGARQLRFYTE